MNILFLDKNLRSIDKLGFLYIARVLKDNGHNVDYLQTDFDDPIAYLKENKIDWVMFSIVTGEQYYVKEMAEKIRRLFPNIKMCAGGPHVTFDINYAEFEKNVDFFVRGAGELVINDIVKGKIKEKVVLGPLPDINAIPVPYRNILYKYPQFGRSKLKRFITMRGCVHSCSYCFNSSLRRTYPSEIPKFLARRDPEKVIEEIIQVRDEFGLGYVYFNDDVFSVYPKWIDKFCKLYKEKVNLPFATSMRADMVNYDILFKLHDAGLCFTNFALETVSEDLQRNLLKRGNINNSQIINAIEICKELRIKTRLQNMIGLPIPNPLEEALDTIEFNQKLAPTDSWVAIYQPEPYTELYDYCVENGYFNPKDLEGVAQTFYGKSVLKIKDKEKINRLAKWWFYLVRYNVDRSFIEELLEIELSEEDARKLQEKRWAIASEELYDL